VGEEVEITERGEAVTFRVRVAPRSGREGITGVHGGAIKVSLTAPPVDGAANAALVRLLAKALGVAKRDVAIVRGESSRDKVIEVRGAAVETVRALARG
jgi:hypothetical protein